MSRTCVDCSAPVSYKSTGRCRSCARAVVLARPGFREAMAEKQRSRWAMQLADPAERQRISEIGKQMRARAAQTPEVVAKQQASRDKLFWCPVEYRDFNARLRRKGFSSAERKLIVLVQIAQDEKAKADRLASMTPFERQLAKVAAGAKLIERRPLPSREYATLGGIASALL